MTKTMSTNLCFSDERKLHMKYDNGFNEDALEC